MGVSYKKGAFAKITTATTQDVTDVGFQPKALILWTSNQTVETYEEHMMVSYGFSDGTTDCVMTCSSEDNVTQSDTYKNAFNDAIIMILNKTTGVREAQATLNSFLSNGFQLSWSVNTTPAAIIHYVAIGGTDITNVKATATQVTTTTTGNYGYTGVGFQPDFLLAVGGPTGPLGNYAFNTTIESGSQFTLSAMTSSSNRWVIHGMSEDGQGTSDTWHFERHDRCFVVTAATSGAIHAEADFVSFDTDGFTWNWTVNDGSTGANHSPILYLAIKGGVWNVGNDTMPTTNSTVTTNTDASATLKGIMTHSIGNTATQTTVTVGNNRICIGGSDVTPNNGLVSYSDNTGSGLMVVTEIQNDNNCIMTHVANATATSSTTLQTGTATLNAHSFGIAYTNTDGTARLMTYWAVSEAAAQGQLYYGTIDNETSVSVSEALARVQVKLNPISETVVTIPEETLARIQTLIKTINESPSTSVSEELARIQTRKFTLSETAIDTSEVLTGTSTQQYDRPISETTISVSEELARIQSLIKLISTESAINIDQTLARTPTYLKPISESTISVSETLERLQTIIKTLAETSVDVDQTLARVQSLITTISAEPAVELDETLARIQTRKFTISETDIILSDLIAATSTQQYDRPISETSVSVSEELERIQSLIKTLSESAVTVPDESLTKISTYPKSIDNESTVSVSEVLARLQSLIKTLAETSVSVPEETVTRVQTLIKLISETPFISVSETLASGLSFTKSILESPSITTDDSIVRLPLHLRPISETPTITTNDSITRWISISYTIAEPSISIDDLLAAGVPVYLRTISESTVDTNDTIVRLMTALKAISETPSITIEDTITRVQSLIKLITNEDPTSVSESLQAGLMYTVSMIESRIKWYYSLLTRKITGGG